MDIKAELNGKTLIGYIRCSTGKQDESRQRNDLTSFAKKHGSFITKEFSDNDTKHGSKRDNLSRRKGWTDLIHFVKLNPNSVVKVQESDRLWAGPRVVMQILEQAATYNFRILSLRTSTTNPAQIS